MSTPTVPLLYQFSVSPPFCPQTPGGFRLKLFSPTGCNIQIRFWTSNSSIVVIQFVSLSSYRFSILSFWLAFSLSFSKSVTNVNVTSFQGFLIRFRLSVKKKIASRSLWPPGVLRRGVQLVSLACCSERHGCEGQSVCCVDRARPHNPALSIKSLLRRKYYSALLTF